MAQSKAKQLMSFQSYVETLSNNLDELTACKKYRDFMADLTQSKEGRFFDTNKDREWFRLKYHPTESQRILQQQNANFLNRLKIFNELNDNKYFDTLSLTSDNADRILNLMNGITIYLESGPQNLVNQLIHNPGSTVDPNILHQYIPSKPNSLVISDLNIETTIAEIQELCLQAHPDLVRVVSLDPYYVSGGTLKRKVVVIYKPDVDIKDVCWNMSKLKLNNHLLNVSINKCLTNRIQIVDSITNQHMCIINEIRNAFILILNFDELKGLYGKRRQILDNNNQADNEVNNHSVKMEVDKNDTAEKDEAIDTFAPLSPPGSDKSANEEEDDKPFDVSSLDEEKEKEKKKILEFRFNIELSIYRQSSKFSKNNNPVLVQAADFLIDYIDSSSARHQLFKICKDLLVEPETTTIDEYLNDKPSLLEMAVQNLYQTVEQSTMVLDKMLWYLRIVHSFDYYKKALYKHEDDLSLRMSVIHLRDDPSQTDMTRFTKDEIRSYIATSDQKFHEFGISQTQRFVTKDEERYNYKSYGKVINDELASYSQRIQKPKTNGTEEVYKCKHCTRVFQKLTDIGRHFVIKHRWAIDAIELETDFFNAYLFDPYKINPCPPRELLEVPTNRFLKMNNNVSEMGEDPELLKQTIEAHNKMDAVVRQPAPRVQIESDPRNEAIADYNDISFDDAI